MKKIAFYWFYISLWILTFCSVYFIFYVDNHPNTQILDLSFYQYFIQMAKLFKPDTKFLAAIIGLLTTLISIAIPLAITKVSDCLRPYNDEEIQRMFHGETVFKQMIFLMILLVISLLMWYFFEASFITGFLLLSFAILSVMFFYMFIIRVIDYITSTDAIVAEYLLNQINNLFLE
jgi:small-conductance mechanosensitive channel